MASRLEAFLQQHLSQDKAEMEYQPDYHNAAVLVPLVWQDDAWQLLFEVRSPCLAWQPGEICFPGGSLEAGDENPEAAAVRETSEELGLAAADIRILGRLKRVISRIGVIIQPCVGIVPADRDYQPNRAEVAELFTVPLDFFASTEPLRASMAFATRPDAGFPFELAPQYQPEWAPRGRYQVYFYRYRQYAIWGITARIINDLLAVCKQQQRY